MTVDDLRARIDKRIHFGNVDPEVSHGDIDQICEDVLRAIAIGSPDAAELATLAVGLLDYEVDHEWIRWYA